MWRIFGACAVAAVCAGCFSGTTTHEGIGHDSRLPSSVISTVVPVPAPFLTWFDPPTAAEIMAARADFDAAEAAAFAEADKKFGAYHDTILITPEQYARQLAGPTAPIARSAAWRREQQRRAAYVWPVLNQAVDHAREALKRRTLAALATFFRNELQTGRISKSDYLRYTVEIRKGYFPGFRGRKWSGPAIYEFRGAEASPEYQKVLQEVRRLWQAQARKVSAVGWMEATPDFYAKLVAHDPT